MEESKQNLEQDANDGLNSNNDQLPGTEEGYNSSRDEKYLELEQPGVTYTKDSSVFRNSDHIEPNTEGNTELFEADENNSRNAEAFGQDEEFLSTNIDLDEDQSESISSENEYDQ